MIEPPDSGPRARSNALVARVIGVFDPYTSNPTAQKEPSAMRRGKRGTA